MTKHWIPVALNWLAQSFEPVPHEINEIDWKARLTGNKERLAEHLIAFANHPNDGFFTFGVQDDATLSGVDQSEVAQIVNTRQRFKLHEKRRTAVSNLLKEAAEKGRIKRKDPDAKSSKFVEYVPYWA